MSATRAWPALRRRVLTPGISNTLLSVRGFHEKTPESREMLETVGAMFLTGYGHAAEAGSSEEARERLEQIPERFRGFAYEGAAMGFAVRDGLPLGGRGHTAAFVDGPARHHSYMAYVGVGWAMARLPRFRWRTLYAPDPLLRWLVLDGYGFHQAYFRTEQYVHRQFQEPEFPWPADGPLWYAQRAIDQGIGRALWFVAGTDPERAADLVDAFPASRRSDLYSGVGLAATYAGGADADELKALLVRSGEYRSDLAQGAVFAATAREEAGLLVPHNRLATEVLLGTTPEAVAELSRRTRPDVAGDGREPAYETWRRRIAAEFPVTPDTLS
ncbi:DUF1702 family protein [Actinacidiphila yeochonensis]|uniref:DUF1702 family protein n=1 Tax=Actinacidiphila yeochonensis TaxID=89050 RepID=UPI00056428EA|nr:DUF1702 family protein [Actinacidiphila yeochonensis]